MSNTEPTEEQRGAENDYLDKHVHIVISNTNFERVADALARLLTEREAKLREEVAELSRGWRADEYELERIRAVLTETQAENDTLRARVAELEVELRVAWGDCDDGSCEACAKCVDQAKHQRDFATARVAELEAEVTQRRRLLAEERGNVGARPAQHLADIKALMGALKDFLVPAAHTIEFNPGHSARALLQRLAHYDDAKADAGAVVEVDDDHKNGPCGWSGCGRCGDTEGGGA